MLAGRRRGFRDRAQRLARIPEHSAAHRATHARKTPAAWNNQELAVDGYKSRWDLGPGDAKAVAAWVLDEVYAAVVG